LVNPGVRPYTPPDGEAVRRIAGDTAFFGQPVEAFLEDRRLFADAFCADYLDLEPEHCWVACAEGQVVGFLMGSVDTRAQRRRWVQRVLPVVAWRALRGHYRLGPLTARYLRTFLAGKLRGEFPREDLRAYQAHLHINVAAPWRGRGLGGALMEAYLSQLCLLRVVGVHLHTTNLNEAACRLYTRMGFRLLAARCTQVWAGLVAGPVENRCYGRRLGPDGPPNRDWELSRFAVLLLLCYTDHRRSRRRSSLCETSLCAWRNGE
jgi:ribosomal protein S18 acetylase RimI-like enzyme